MKSKVIAISIFFISKIIANNWAEETLQKLSLKEKVGQLFMVATASDFNQKEEALATRMFHCPYKMEHEHIEHLIREYGIGGIIFLYKSTVPKQIKLMNHLKNLTKVPLLFGQDCEWGLSMRLYDTEEFPKNIELGKIDNPELTYKIGKEIGRQCREIGLHINFAPVADVNTNPNNIVIGKRSFGSNKELVTKHSVAIMCGMQDSGLLTCAKHFPGHGDTSTDSHLGLPILEHTKERIQNIELYPFKKLVEAGVDAIMTAHIALPQLDPSGISATLSKKLLNLKNEIGFNGLMITDGLGMQALTKHFQPGEIELEALLAGNDILLCPLDVPKAVALILQAVKDGKITEEEINQKVRKILKAKQRFLNERPIDAAVAQASVSTPGLKAGASSM